MYSEEHWPAMVNVAENEEHGFINIFQSKRLSISSFVYSSVENRNKRGWHMAIYTEFLDRGTSSSLLRREVLKYQCLLVSRKAR